jgi:hypothetical protein
VAAEGVDGGAGAGGAHGLTAAMLSTGKPVTLFGQVRKDGTPEMKVERLTLDGKVFELR